MIGLRKVQEACCYEPINPGNKIQEEYGEDDFNVEVARCVIRLMGVKKSEGVGDKLVRFLGLFLRHACEKGRRRITLSNSERILIAYRCCSPSRRWP